MLNNDFRKIKPHNTIISVFFLRVDMAGTLWLNTHHNKPVDFLIE